MQTRSTSSRISVQPKREENIVKRLVQLCDVPWIKAVKGGYLVLSGTAMAVYFIISAVMDTETDSSVWSVIDVFVLLAVVLLMLSSLERKSAVSGSDSVTREYLEANMSFYLTAAVGGGFVYNYLAWKFSPSSNPLDASSYELWLMADMILPLLLIPNGIRLLRSARSA